MMNEPPCVCGFHHGSSVPCGRIEYLAEDSHAACHAEIERLKGEYRKVYDWGETLDRDCNALTADLAAARAAIERVEANTWRAAAAIIRERTHLRAVDLADVLEEHARYAALREEEGVKDGR